MFQCDMCRCFIYHGNLLFLDMNSEIVADYNYVLEIVFAFLTAIVLMSA